MLTPNNRTQKFFKNPATIAECWIDSTYSPQLVALVSRYGQPYVEKLIIRACARINKLCNRYFNNQEADEVFMRIKDNFYGYQTFVLQNAPINTITDVYVGYVDGFTLLDSTYFELSAAARIFKCIPLVSVISSLIGPANYYPSEAFNLWIRYTSGYTTSNVPEDVKGCTADLAVYMATAVNSGGLKNFSTLTYSQGNSTPDTDPLLMNIKEELAFYNLSNIA